MDDQSRREIAHIAWWGMVLCVAGALAVVALLIWQVISAI